MAKKKISKKTQKKVARTAKKYPFLIVVALILVVAIVGCYLLHQKGIIHLSFLDNSSSATGDSSFTDSSLDDSSFEDSSLDDSSLDDGSSEDSSLDDSSFEDSSGGEPNDVVTDEFSIHFLEVGNQYTGDCTLIKVGDTEVLIDAGSRKNSAGAIATYLQQYCTDGVLEYVIATHAHQDHVAGFIGNSQGGTRNGILYTYEVETLIQFTKTNLSLTTDKGNPTLYAEYVDAVEYAKDKGTTVYTIMDCWNQVNGAQRSYQLADDITMRFLYQEFYEKNTSDENDYSICMLLTQGENNYLFTGDLEHRGEESLVKNNDLPKCVLYKGGHHGSPTSSTAALLEVIQPEIVCVCCCCGSTEYTSNMENVFPSQAFVDRIAPYTDQVYVTTLVVGSNGYTSMNGNIVVTTKEGAVSVNCSNNNTLFKDTEWFKENRTCPTAWQ